MPDSVTQDINVITDGDYSSVYTDALSTSSVITIDFPSATPVGYIAIGGSSITRKDRVEITAVDNVSRDQMFG